MKVTVPPIKSQGIKTRLVPWISNIVPNDIGRWIEPFMGTGVVAFNLASKRALLCDTNPHLIAFYQGISSGEITPERVRHYLETEGARLSEKGESHYYEIRERFNERHRPLDFLFLRFFVEECENPYTIPIRRTVLLESAQSPWKSKITIANY